MLIRFLVHLLLQAALHIMEVLASSAQQVPQSLVQLLEQPCCARLALVPTIEAILLHLSFSDANSLALRHISIQVFKSKTS